MLETLTTQKACLLVMLIINIVIIYINFFLSQVRSHCSESLVEDLSCFPSNITKYAYFHMIPFPFVNNYIYRCTQTLCAYISTIFDAILTQTPCHHHRGRQAGKEVIVIKQLDETDFACLLFNHLRRRPHPDTMSSSLRPSSQQKGHSYQVIRRGIPQSKCSSYALFLSHIYCGFRSLLFSKAVKPAKRS
jgi:hypothetical protein